MYAYSRVGFSQSVCLSVCYDSSTNISMLQSEYVLRLHTHTHTHTHRSILFPHNSLLNKQQTLVLFLELPRHHFPLSQSFLAIRCFALTPILQHQISCYLPGLYLIFILLLYQFLSLSLRLSHFPHLFTVLKHSNCRSQAQLHCTSTGLHWVNYMKQDQAMLFHIFGR